MLAPLYAPEVEGKSPQQLEAYKRMPDSVLFQVQEVQVDLSEYDIPGPTRRKVSCFRCGQVIRDNREVVMDDLPLCRPCAHGAYFKHAREITWQDMNWSPVSDFRAKKQQRNMPVDSEEPSTSNRLGQPGAKRHREKLQ